MENEELIRLLDCYYRAETSADEEKRLFDYFRNNPVPPRFEADKALFLSLYDASGEEVSLPAGLEERIAAQIDSFGREEHRHWFTVRKARIWVASVAAILLVAFTVGIIALRPVPRQDTFTSTQEAYAETKRALALFAAKLDKGMIAVQRVEQTQTSIEKQLNKINHETDMYIFAVDSI